MTRPKTTHEQYQAIIHTVMSRPDLTYVMNSQRASDMVEIAKGLTYVTHDEESDQDTSTTNEDSSTTDGQMLIIPLHEFERTQMKIQTLTEKNTLLQREREEWQFRIGELQNQLNKAQSDLSYWRQQAEVSIRWEPSIPEHVIDDTSSSSVTHDYWRGKYEQADRQATFLEQFVRQQNPDPADLMPVVIPLCMLVLISGGILTVLLPGL